MKLMREITGIVFAVLGLWLFFSSEAFARLTHVNEWSWSVAIVSVFVGWATGGIAFSLGDWVWAFITYVWQHLFHKSPPLANVAADYVVNGIITEARNNGAKPIQMRSWRKNTGEELEKKYGIKN